MACSHSPPPQRTVCRRDFLKSAAAGVAAGTSVSAQATVSVRPGHDRRSVIMICNLGGPSQLDTWDPKPHAPAEVRGPFTAIRTTVPGVVVSELFPYHARIAHHLAFVRSCFHTSPALHHAGWQCLQTGREFTDQLESPHLGSTVGYLLGPRGELPPHILLPEPLGTEQASASTGQSAGVLGSIHDPVVVDVPYYSPARDRRSASRSLTPSLSGALDVTREPAKVRERYGHTPLGQRLLAARRLVAAGVRWVTVNAFTDLIEGPSWDVHGRAPFARVEQLRHYVAPVYDRAVSGLIADLHDRGLLAETLVCCVGEFGRTPKLNSEGGRDHWPACFTTCLAGGGVRGGQVLGRSDATASSPVERPVAAAELAATICYSLGLHSATPWTDSGGAPRTLIPGAAEPVIELF